MSKLVWDSPCCEVVDESEEARSQVHDIRSRLHWFRPGRSISLQMSRRAQSDHKKNVAHVSKPQTRRDETSDLMLTAGSSRSSCWTINRNTLQQQSRLDSCCLRVLTALLLLLLRKSDCCPPWSRSNNIQNDVQTELCWVQQKAWREKKGGNRPKTRVSPRAPSHHALAKHPPFVPWAAAAAAEALLLAYRAMHRNWSTEVVVPNAQLCEKWRERWIYQLFAKNKMRRIMSSRTWIQNMQS